MTTVFLVPRRKDHGHRDRLWAFCRAKWEREHPDFPIFEGHHDEGPFNRAAAINRAADLAGEWDVGVVIDSDVMVSQQALRDAVARAAERNEVVWPFTEWRGLTPRGTERLMRDGVPDDLDPLTDKLNPISWSCCFAIPRKVWDDMGGFDERFRGWGWEDMAFKTVVLTRYGAEHLPGEVIHLWHDRSAERAEVRRPDGNILIAPEYLENTILGRTYMWAEGLPEVIDRLVEGAKAAREQSKEQARSVVVMALTVGRRDYLERTLASFEEMVTGAPVVRRIWDDSGNPEYVTWLRERFPTWHVVGDLNGRFVHRGYTPALQAMWRYLTSRVFTPYVFLLEEDFTFDVPVDLGAMIDVLEARPHLAQLALLRHPFYDREQAGGILGHPPDAFEPASLNGHRWLEHRRFWTNNPMMFRRILASRRPWPAGRHSEAEYGRMLCQDPNLRFGFWGEGEPAVTHIGDERHALAERY